jgi:hypothetical protein
MHISFKQKIYRDAHLARRTRTFHMKFHSVFNTQHSTDHYTVLRSTHLTVYHGMTPQTTKMNLTLFHSICASSVWSSPRVRTESGPMRNWTAIGLILRMRTECALVYWTGLMMN